MLCTFQDQASAAYGNVDMLSGAAHSQPGADSMPIEVLGSLSTDFHGLWVRPVVRPFVRADMKSETS